MAIEFPKLEDLFNPSAPHNLPRNIPQPDMGTGTEIEDPFKPKPAPSLGAQFMGPQQAQNPLIPGNINLNNRPIVKNPDVSTLPFPSPRTYSILPRPTTWLRLEHLKNGEIFFSRIILLLRPSPPRQKIFRRSLQCRDPSRGHRSPSPSPKAGDGSEI